MDWFLWRTCQPCDFLVMVHRGNWARRSATVPVFLLFPLKFFFFPGMKTRIMGAVFAKGESFAVTYKKPRWLWYKTDADCWVDKLYKLTVIGEHRRTVSPHFLSCCPFTHIKHTYIPTVSLPLPLSHTHTHSQLLLLHCLLLIKCISPLWL